MRILFLALMTTVCMSLMAQNTSDIERYASAVARIEVTNKHGAVLGSGSGFVFDGGNRILTNAHVVADAMYNDEVDIELVFPGEGDEEDERIPAVIDSFNARMDLSSLRVEESLPVSLSLSQVNVPPIMTEILVLGYPLGRAFKATPGHVQALQKINRIGTMLDLSAKVDPGNSGGPVVNSQGQVVGIVTSRFPSYNFNLAITPQLIRLFLDGESGLTELIIAPDIHDSRVFINDHYEGISPLTVFIPSIPITVRIQADGYEELEEVVDPRETEFFRPDLIPLEPSGPTITITTNPPGASVTVNNRALGESPAEFEAEAGKRLRVRVTESGYRDFYEEYWGSDSEEQLIEISLEKKGFSR